MGHPLILTLLIVKTEKKLIYCFLFYNFSFDTSKLEFVLTQFLLIKDILKLFSNTHIFDQLLSKIYDSLLEALRPRMPSMASSRSESVSQHR